MCILVTGGAGYVGGHMVLALRDAAREVVVVDNLSTGFLSSLSVPFYQGNCGDEALITEIVQRHGVKAIIHLAASIVVPDSFIDPLGYYLNNTVHFRSLIAVAIRQGVREFIFSSSAAVYGDPARTPISEDDQLHPISPYGTSKMMTELMLEDAARAHDFKFVALRYFNVAGADPAQRWGQSSPRATHLIKLACQVAMGARPCLKVFGNDYPTPDGTCIRDYVHVSDLVNAHILALDHLKSGAGSLKLNCGYGKGYSVLQVIEAVRNASGKDFPVEAAPRRAGDPPVLVARADRIRKALGWSPSFQDLNTIVSHALAWESKLKNNAP